MINLFNIYYVPVFPPTHLNQKLTTIITILNMRKTRVKKAKRRTQVHTIKKWPSWDSNVDLSGSQILHFTAVTP